MSASTRPSKRRWFIFAAIGAVFAGGVWYFGFKAERQLPQSTGFSHKRGPGGFLGGMEAVPVKTVAAKRDALAVYLKAIGTVTPLNTVTVRSRVEGQLIRVAFTEGQKVRKGDLLAVIDPDPYKIKLAQAEGNQKQNLAQLQNAERDLDRLKQLFEKTLVTAQELDAAQARVAERRGALAANEAQVEDARLQLAYTRIEAPIDGRLGLRQVDPGNLIRPGDSSGLVVITQTQPISVVFTIPEVDLQKVLEPLRSGKELAVEAWDRNEQHLVETGVLRTVDNQINIATGTVRLKAEFSNADEILFPNQFVNVRLRVNTVENAIVIPADAVQFGSRGTYVYVVDAKSRSIIHDVVLGPSDGTWQAVTQGVTVGDQVVLEGLDRLREGRPVKIVNDTPEPTPTRSRAKSS